MDAETSDAIARMGERIGALQAELHASTHELRREFRDGLAENRRHSEVLFESLRHDIRLAAEGLAVVSAKLDSMRP
jgi:hypothetical protein